MKTTLRRTLLGASLGIALGSTAQAQIAPVLGTTGYLGLPNSGIIHFFGNILDVACTVSVNGQGPTGYVILPPRMVSDFPHVGDTSGHTGFTLEFSDCPDMASGLDAWPYFFAGHADATTGLLRNIPGIGQAIGVGLELTDGNPSGGFKVYQGATPFGNQGPKQPVAAGTFSMKYGVQYIRTGGITPGAVRSNVDYIVYYQ